MKPLKQWPLAVSTFTLRDKLRIARHVLTSDQYTMGPHVAEFERRMTEFSGMHALGVASGSAANHLVFQLWREKNPHENAVVICPAVTWISAVSPAVMAGFDVKFCDVNRTDLSFDYVALEAMLKKLRRNSRKRIIIWPTALLGYVPDMAKLGYLRGRYLADLFMDCCENTLSPYTPRVQSGKFEYDSFDRSILASCGITTTSCYFAHQIQAIEFGFVFLRDAHDYQLARMIRNHGMSRSLTDEEMGREYIACSAPTTAQAT
jgi:CDP-6-deoxy-D-xylo-4-hexulose-3-dehydrase